MAADVLIDVRNLRVDYEQVCAVRDLSLQVQAGEVYGLIGPNGAGKTSTMRSVMGLIPPTSGSIHMNGVNLMEDHEAAVQQIGFMPDFSPLYDDLTCWEYLDLFAHSYHVPVSRRRELIRQHLEMVQLTEKTGQMTVGLSRGMKQRLMLAKTLIPDPPIILLDEPASGMDPNARLLLKDILIEQAKRGKAIMISSHILPELSEMCTSVGIMERGAMVVTGRVTDITARIMGHAELDIGVLSGEEQLSRVLREDPRAGEPSQHGDMIRVTYEGTPEETADLLARLVASGVRVVSFNQRTVGLEEVFLKVGAREVS